MGAYTCFVGSGKQTLIDLQNVTKEFRPVIKSYFMVRENGKNVIW